MRLKLAFTQTYEFYLSALILFCSKSWWLFEYVKLLRKFYQNMFPPGILIFVVFGFSSVINRTFPNDWVWNVAYKAMIQK